MLTKEMKKILKDSEATGWILEPEAKRLLDLAGLPVAKHAWVSTCDAAVQAAERIGYPVVAKVVSPLVLHKSDYGGVVVGIENKTKLAEVYHHFSTIDQFSGVLVEENLCGVELIIGAKVDFQFGPIILLGIGGTAVEIYRDTTIRMAPLTPDDAQSMIGNLKARRLLEGYRGSEAINLKALTRTIIKFSDFLMALANHIASIDLNPVMCTSERCVVADARIVLTAR
jgi:succinyl-CoA synthetase beta subunit